MASPAVAPSISEVDARSGHLLRKVAGSSFALDNPLALTVAGPDAYIADEANNAVTEIDIASGALVRLITGQGLANPDGIAVSAGNVWVADAGSNAATDIDQATGAILTTVNDSDGQYGFGRPSVAIESDGNVFIASPYGTSPMVTKLSATTGAPSWYMCNTNGPYYFSLLSAFAVSGDHLWVASRSGANSQTPGARTGSLTELDTGSGALIATLPLIRVNHYTPGDDRRRATISQWRPPSPGRSPPCRKVTSKGILSGAQTTSLSSSPTPILPGRSRVRMPFVPTSRRALATFSMDLAVTRLLGGFDPDLLIAEYTCEGHVTTTGKPYSNAYIAIVQFQRGLIHSQREYYNPVPALRALAAG